MATSSKNYEEKGIVLKSQDYNKELEGKVVYFDSWMAAKFEEGTENEFWLIPYSAVRAYED